MSEEHKCPQCGGLILILHEKGPCELNVIYSHQIEDKLKTVNEHLVDQLARIGQLERDVERLESLNNMN